MTSSQINDAYTAHTASPSPTTESHLYDSIRRYALDIARSNGASDPEEIAVETMLSAWKSDSTYRGESSRATWLRRIAERRVQDSYRRDYRIPISAESDDDAEAISLESDRQMYDVSDLTCLDDEERTLLHRLVVLGSYADLAAELGMSRSSLRTRLNRIRKKVERDVAMWRSPTTI